MTATQEPTPNEADRKAAHDLLDQMGRLTREQRNSAPATQDRFAEAFAQHRLHSSAEAVREATEPIAKALLDSDNMLWSMHNNLVHRGNLAGAAQIMSQIERNHSVLPAHHPVHSFRRKSGL